MREITFYNMSFGDSFLIRDDNHGLLVDCGTYNDPLNITSITTSLITRDLISLSQKNLLITHYHMDHFICLLKLGVKFDTIYVRNLGSRVLRFTFASAFSELIKYAHKTGDYKTFSAWLSRGVLNNLLHRGGVVLGLNNNIFKHFKIGPSSADVLWPTTNLPSSKLAKMDECSEKIESIIERKASESVRRYLDGTKHFWEEVFAYIDKEKANSEGWDNLLNKSSDSYELKFEEAEQLVNDVAPLLEDIKGDLLDLENYLSIVFEIDGKLLMCGDATKTAMREAMKHSTLNNSNKYYEIIKIPHHGTHRHYFNYHYNHSTDLLIPNSYQIHSSSWSIDYRYSYPSTARCHCLNNCIHSACKTPCHQRGYVFVLCKKLYF